MATKPDLKGNYLLAEHASLHRNAITSDDVTRLWQTKRSDSGSDQSGLVGAFVSQTRQKLGLLGGELLRRENALPSQFGQPCDLDRPLLAQAL